jgi:hypothetical protein
MENVELGWHGRPWEGLELRDVGDVVMRDEVMRDCVAVVVCCYCVCFVLRLCV